MWSQATRTVRAHFYGGRRERDRPAGEPRAAAPETLVICKEVAYQSLQTLPFLVEERQQARREAKLCQAAAAKARMKALKISKNEDPEGRRATEKSLGRVTAKTVKFIDSPTIEQLRRQLVTVTEKLPVICGVEKSFDVDTEL